jgi:hypothetical protein
MFKGAVYSGLRCFHDFSSDDHFVEDLIDLVKVEDEVQFAHTTEVLIEHFNEQVNKLKRTS